MSSHQQRLQFTNLAQHGKGIYRRQHGQLLNDGSQKSAPNDSFFPMATHRAYFHLKLGGKVELKHVSTPKPSLGEILVDVLATPILSYTNTVLAGSLFPPVHPLTPGISAIGRISSTRIDSTVLHSGQLVFYVPIVRARDDAGNSILQGWFGGATTEAKKLMEVPRAQRAWAEKMIVPTENTVVLDEERLLGELGYTVPQLIWSMFLQ